MFHSTFRCPFGYLVFGSVAPFLSVTLEKINTKQNFPFILATVEASRLFVSRLGRTMNIYRVKNYPNIYIYCISVKRTITVYVSREYSQIIGGKRSHWYLSVVYRIVGLSFFKCCILTLRSELGYAQVDLTMVIGGIVTCTQ